MTTFPTRRSALGLLAAAGAASLARPAPAAAQLLAPPSGLLPIPGRGAAGGVPDGLRFARFAVDASALRTPENAALADLVARAMSAQLAAVFADRRAAPGGRGATLVARVLSLYLPYYPGGRDRGGNGPDNIEGVGLVTSGGGIVSETPVYTTLTPSYSGPWYAPDIREKRVANICYQFAYWLRRDMGI